MHGCHKSRTARTVRSRGPLKPVKKLPALGALVCRRRLPLPICLALVVRSATGVASYSFFNGLLIRRTIACIGVAHPEFGQWRIASRRPLGRALVPPAKNQRQPAFSFGPEASAADVAKRQRRFPNETADVSSSPVGIWASSFLLSDGQLPCRDASTRESRAACLPQVDSRPKLAVVTGPLPWRCRLPFSRGRAQGLAAEPAPQRRGFALHGEAAW